MACNTTDLIASWPGIENLGLEDLMIVKLALLAQIAVAIDPAANVSADALMVAGNAAGFDKLSQKEARMVRLSLLCQLASS